MFERIKAYKKLNKMDKFLKGVIVMGEITNDKEVINQANETLMKNEILRKKIIFDRKTAIKYNLEFIRKGF